MIPARVLPPQALIVAVTPLLDDRAVEALADLRAAALRPRDRRGLADRLHRAGRERVGQAGAPALGAAAQRDPRALRAARRRRGELERRRASRRGAGGGEGIQAPRADRARLAAGAAAVVGAAGTGIWLAAIAEDGYLVNATLLAGFVAAAVARRRARAAPADRDSGGDLPARGSVRGRARLRDRRDRHARTAARRAALRRRRARVLVARAAWDARRRARHVPAARRAAGNPCPRDDRRRHGGARGRRARRGAGRRGRPGRRDRRSRRDRAAGAGGDQAERAERASGCSACAS